MVWGNITYARMHTHSTVCSRMCVHTHEHIYKCTLLCIHRLTIMRQILCILQIISPGVSNKVLASAALPFLPVKAQSGGQLAWQWLLGGNSCMG